VAALDDHSAAFVDEAIGVLGVIAAGLIDAESGAMLRAAGATDGEFAPLANVMRRYVAAKRVLLASLGQAELIENIVIGLTDRVLVLRPLPTERVTLLFMVLDKRWANLPLVLRRLDRIDARLRDSGVAPAG
jgi:hypothetical protein